MKFGSLALAALTLFSSASAYLVTGDDLNCRTKPGTSHPAVKVYKKGQDIKITCQTIGPVIDGNNIWDKTSDGCFVTDRYVKTGSSKMIMKDCFPPAPPPTGKSTYQGTITRQEILDRGYFWVNKHVPYSMSRTTGDPQGRAYRTDCSGFVSMAFHSLAPGRSTVSLGEIGRRIQWNELKPGDMVGTIGPGTSGAAGHVTLFLSWADKAHTRYNTLECRGGAGCVKYARNKGWGVGGFTAQPWRYNKVVD